MKYTRGLWIAVGAYVEHPSDTIADICCCDPEVFEGEGYPKRSWQENFANARLCAAAPELYAACVAMLSERTAAAQLSDACLMAYSAIAKATGTKKGQPPRNGRKS